MKPFREFVEEGKVRKGSLRHAEAHSLLEQSYERMEDLLSLPLTEKNASFRFEDAYESIREALQSFLALEGYKPYSHEAIVSFAFERQLLPEPKIMQIDRYREMRNDINYRGKKVSVEEAKEAVAFAKDAIAALRRRLQTATLK